MAIPWYSHGQFGPIQRGAQGGVGEGKPSPRFSFGGGWEGGFDQLISSRPYTPEAKASADYSRPSRTIDLVEAINLVQVSPKTVVTMTSYGSLKLA